MLAAVSFHHSALSDEAERLFGLAPLAAAEAVEAVDAEHRCC